MDVLAVPVPVPVQSHVCIYRQLRQATQYTRVRTSTRLAHVTFGRAAEILPQLKKREKEVYMFTYEVELPLNLQGMNQQDRACIIKMILEVAIEIYKKQFPHSTFDFIPRMCNEVHTGGELQAVVNLLAHTVTSSKNKTRLQTLKIAIRDSTEVSVLPLVYLYTMADSTVGVMNAYPRSQFRVQDSASAHAINGYVKYGEQQVGASAVGVVLKRFSEKMGQSSCDALSLKDPRLHLLQENTQDSYNHPTQYAYVGDASNLQQQQQQQQSNNSPKWLKSYCVDVLGDIYRSVQFDVIQRTRHTPTSALGGLETRNAVIQNALVPSTTNGEQSPIMSFLSVIRNCVDAMETVASDIVSAHFLSQDLVPLPFNFYRYVLPALRNAQHLGEARETLVNYQNNDAEALTMHCNVSSLLSFQTKKKARLASLLYKSEEASRRLENPPRNTRNMKEFEEPKTLQRKIQENSEEVDVAFLEDVTQIFGAHESHNNNYNSNHNDHNNNNNNNDLVSSGKQQCQWQSQWQPLYAAEVEGLAGVRLETMEPVPPPVGIHTGLSGDCGAETGGLPPNDLQHFIRTLCAQKALKSRKRKVVHGMLSPTALTTVAILLEELATEMVLSWRQRIVAPPTTENNNHNQMASGHKRQRDAPLQTTELLPSPSLSPSPPPTVHLPSSSLLPPLLPYDPHTFAREVDLQLQGADLEDDDDDGRGGGGGGGVAWVEEVVRNRMQILFGEREVSTPANIALIHSRVQAEWTFQTQQDNELTGLFRDECKHTKECLPRKRFKF